MPRDGLRLHASAGNPALRRAFAYTLPPPRARRSAVQSRCRARYAGARLTLAGPRLMKRPVPPTQTPSPAPATGRTATANVALGYVGVLLTIGLVWMIATPPGVFSDSVFGFLVMRSMERGAPANHTLSVDVDDIAVDVAEFTAWWTPGQYAIPMLFGALGLDLGESLRITILLGWLIGGLGLWRLLRALAFSREASAVSLAVLVSQSYVLDWSRFYHGGGLLEWAYLPWFALLALRCRSFAWSQVLPLALGLMLGIFFKSSFAILGACVLASVLWLEVQAAGGPLRPRSIGLASRAGAAVLLALAAFYAYISSGDSPAGGRAQGGLQLDLREFLFAAAGPLNSVFDLWTLYVPPSEAVTWTADGISAPLLLTGVATVALLFAIARYADCSREYVALAAGVYAFGVASYTLAWLIDLEISFNARHFRGIGLFLVPGSVALLMGLRTRVARAAGLALIAALCLVSAARFAYPTERDPLARPVGPAGFSHIYASQAAVDALAEIDAALDSGNALIAVPWPQMALDIQHARVFDMRLALRGAEAFQHAVYFGRVDDLVVVIPMQDDARGATPVLLRAFREHREWRRIRPDVEDYVFMHSGRSSGLD